MPRMPTKQGCRRKIKFGTEEKVDYVTQLKNAIMHYTVSRYDIFRLTLYRNTAIVFRKNGEAKWAATGAEVGTA